MPKITNFRTAAFASAAAMSALTLAVSAVPAQADHHGSMKAKAKAQPNIVGAASGTGVHTTLVAAVKAAGLVDTLSSPGPFTVFAPTDAAFAKLPAGTVDTLLKPENKEQLTSVLTYHVVTGRVPAAALTQAIRRAGGTYRFQTVAGTELTARLEGNGIAITDAAGRVTRVTQADVKTSNGVIHVTNGVFLPG